MECPYCREYVGEIKCGSCGKIIKACDINVQDIIYLKRSKYKDYGEIYYDYGRQFIFCPNCGYEGTGTSRKLKYGFLVRILIFILCMIWCVGLFGVGVYIQRQEDKSICTCPKCGNTRLGTNGATKKPKGWFRFFFFLGLIVWIVIGIFLFIEFKYGG